ncbi:hypothetical protein ACF8GD_00245 [Pseudomonas putida]|uniref:hypothetical protein n=1 Tax=Pseudomonas putida TaxID=303 RepID=UPI00370A7EDD
MTPDATRHNPDPLYLRQLLQAAGLNQLQAAERLGITGRVLRYYLSDADSAGYRPAPYLVQFALERLAAAAAEVVDVAPRLVEAPAPENVALQGWRALTDADVIEQAPAGLGWEDGREAVERQVLERFWELPPDFHAHGYDPLILGVWPPAAIEPALFELVMQGHAQLRGMQREQARNRLALLWQDVRRPRHPLLILIALERLLAVVHDWKAQGVLSHREADDLILNALVRRERITEQVAEQARRYDPNVIPWAYRKALESPIIELQQAPRFAGKVGQRRLRQAEAEWQAQHLEKQAATLVSNAEALRHRWGGPLQTAGALRSVSRHIPERTEPNDD